MTWTPGEAVPEHVAGWALQPGPHTLAGAAVTPRSLRRTTMVCSGDASCRQVGGTGVEEASQVRERVLSVEGGFGAASGWASADPHSGEIGSLVY